MDPKYLVYDKYKNCFYMVKDFVGQRKEQQHSYMLTGDLERYAEKPDLLDGELVKIVMDRKNERKNSL